ncbi:MAG: ATP-binding protein [Bacilli bacterium]|nr:ATP-binding protein [Bacilli bacterium]
MAELKRKIDIYLKEWKNSKNRKPLIIKGARQIGKTTSIEKFGRENYKSFIEINYISMPQYKQIFQDGYTTENIIKNISLLNSEYKFIPGDTLIFFDEMQEYPDTATSLKFFNEDGRFDVICSGSLMGINYNQIHSNSVGNKEDYTMRSLDFEEFLWAKGYGEEQIESLYICMKEVKPLTNIQFDVMMNNFKDYLITGGMPEIVSTFIDNKNFSGILNMQQKLLTDYEEDITKYAGGLDKSKILDAYKKIKIFLGNDNKKFQITKLKDGARNREYVGVIDWMDRAGIINISYALDHLEMPLKANYNPDNYRLYFGDTGLLIGSLDEESQSDLRNNQNFGTYKGALYENIVAEMLTKAGFDLFFYRDEQSKIEMDFIIRDEKSIIPVEVKAGDNATYSLNRLIDEKQYKNIKYGIKLCNKNIGFNGKFYTFPYFMTFMLKRFLKEKQN